MPVGPRRARLCGDTGGFAKVHGTSIIWADTLEASSFNFDVCGLDANRGHHGEALAVAANQFLLVTDSALWLTSVDGHAALTERIDFAQARCQYFIVQWR